MIIFGLILGLFSMYVVCVVFNFVFSIIMFICDAFCENKDKH